jgi:hypothetical protein
MPYVLKEWSVVEKVSDPYQAPELRRHGLKGKVYGHPEFFDGEPIVTSSGIRAEGRHVWTKSGTEYVLEGPPDENYVKYLNENSIPMDLNEPFGKTGQV